MAYRPRSSRTQGENDRNREACRERMREKLLDPNFVAMKAGKQRAMRALLKEMGVNPFPNTDKAKAARRRYADKKKRQRLLTAYRAEHFDPSVDYDAIVKTITLPTK